MFSCVEVGVIGLLSGVIGLIMVMEVVKIIVGVGVVLWGEMLIYDGFYGEICKIGLKCCVDCFCCGLK